MTGEIPFTYPKMENLFARMMEGPQTGKLIPGEFKDKAVSLLRPDYAWRFLEKVDGTNIRIYSYVEDGQRKWCLNGRSNQAQLPGKLVAEISRLMETVHPLVCEKTQGNVVFVGEGYGAGIQKGGGYSDDQKFILFDIVTLDGEHKHFLDWPNVKLLGEAVGFEVVPEVPEVYTLTDAVDLVQRGFTTLVGKKAGEAEGIVGRTVPNLYYHCDGGLKPLRFKLKTKDFPRASVSKGQPGIAAIEVEPRVRI